MAMSGQSVQGASIGQCSQSPAVESRASSEVLDVVKSETLRRSGVLVKA
jgi:hypothetical protein